MVELRELLRIAALGLQLRACTDARDTRLRWALPLDDVRDVEACTGGELVVTRGWWRRSPADADRLVCELVQRRAGALALQPASGAMLDELVTACERWRLPLVVIPARVSVAEVVETAITIALHRRNATALRLQERQRTLLSRLGESDAIPALAAQLGRDLACPVWVQTPAGAVAAADGPELPDADLKAIAAAVCGRRGTVELVAEDGGPLLVVPVGPPSARPLAHLVAGVPSVELSADDRAALDDVVGLVERQLLVMRRGRAARRPVCQEFLARAAEEGAAGTGLDAWSRALGVPMPAHVVCVVADIRGATPEEILAVADAVDEAAEQHGVARVVAAQDDEAVALLFAGTMSAELEAIVERMGLALRPELQRLDGVMGHSSVMARSPADAIRMVHDARRVAQLNALREPEPEHETVTSGPEAPLSALLLMGNDEALGALHEVMLAPLVEYDAQHGTELVRTLDVFLTNDGQWSASAAELGVHVNTLRYRLARIEKCTGRDPAAMSNRVDYYVALRARQAARQPPAGRPVARR